MNRTLAARQRAVSVAQRGLAALGRGLARVPGLSVLGRALLNYIFHDSANQAGHVAFSAVLSLFPFLLFLSAAASYLGTPGTEHGLVDAVAYYAPPAVAETLRPVIAEVLSQRNRAVLAIGIFGTLWTASSGVQAVRMALNRAYCVTNGLPFWKARIKVMIITAIGTAAMVFAFSSVVILPYAQALIHQNLGAGEAAFWAWTGTRYGIAFVVLTLFYAILYRWLPDSPQTLNSALPGAVFGAAAWLALATALSWSFRGATKLTLIYGSFAGVVATLIFLYVSAATLILGAEINSVLKQRRAVEAVKN